MAKMNLRPTHDQALVIPRPDIHAKIMGIWDDGIQDGFISTELWGKVRVDCPITYKIPSPRNRFGMFQVDSWGEGTMRGAGLDKPEVEKGDIVGIDLCQVSHVVAHDGKEKWFVPWKEFLCKFDPVTLQPTPLMNFVMTEYDEEIMNHLIFKGNSNLVAVSSVHANGIQTNSNPHTNVRVAAERVVAVGQGRFVKSVWTEPGCKVGDGAIFMPCNATVDMKLTGNRKRFTPWSEIEGVLYND